MFGLHYEFFLVGFILPKSMSYLDKPTPILLDFYCCETVIFLYSAISDKKANKAP